MSSGGPPTQTFATGAIIGIVIGTLAGAGVLVYLCCFRKQVTARKTQKLMDATNLIHAQEPQGTVSPEVLPDGSVGLLVRPLPPLTVTATVGGMDAYSQQPVVPGIARVSASNSPYAPHLYSHPEGTLRVVPVIPSISPIPLMPPVPSTSLPSAPTLQQLQFSSHPRPGVVTTLSDEVKGGDDDEEAKEEPSLEVWEPKPFVSPMRATGPGSQGNRQPSFSQTGSGSRSLAAGGQATHLALGSGLRSGSGGVLAWTSSAPATTQATPPNLSSDSPPLMPNHSKPTSSQRTLLESNMGTVRQERHPQEVSDSSSATSVPSPSSSATAIAGVIYNNNNGYNNYVLERKYPEMDPTMVPPRPLHSPHKPIDPCMQGFQGISP